MIKTYFHHILQVLYYSEGQSGFSKANPLSLGLSVMFYLLQILVWSLRHRRGREEAQAGQGDQSVEGHWGSTPVLEPFPRVLCTPWSRGRERETWRG